MLAIEFRLKISSMYSIRVPYSYQCARTYPLPAPSTIKGLCANALWRKEGGDPVELISAIHEASLGATSRAEQSIAVSSCTVRVVPMNALLRQFAFTPYIDCLIAFKDGNETIAEKILEALKYSSIYLGDSESLVSIVPDSINSDVQLTDIQEGDAVSINSLLKFDFVRNNSINEKGVVLYMQDDPCSGDAVLDRYIAPLKQQGDSYNPIASFNFISSKPCFVIEGRKLKGIFCEPLSEELVEQKSQSVQEKR